MNVTRNFPAASRAGHAVLARSLLASACVSHQAVDTRREKIAAELEPGDGVKIVLHSGEEVTFRVTEIWKAGLAGDTGTDIAKGKIVTVPYEDIRQLKRVDQRPLVVIGTAVAVPFAILFSLVAIAFATF